MVLQDSVLHRSNTETNLPSARPLIWTGFLGLTGPRPRKERYKKSKRKVEPGIKYFYTHCQDILISYDVKLVISYGYRILNSNNNEKAQKSKFELLILNAGELGIYPTV